MLGRARISVCAADAGRAVLGDARSRSSRRRGHIGCLRLGAGLTPVRQVGTVPTETLCVEYKGSQVRILSQRPIKSITCIITTSPKSIGVHPGVHLATFSSQPRVHIRKAVGPHIKLTRSDFHHLLEEQERALELLLRSILLLARLTPGTGFTRKFR